MNELLDLVTRSYEYQRAQPLLFETTNGLETVQRALEGKLPTPPILPTLGISLVEARRVAPPARARRPSGNITTSEPYMEGGFPRYLTPPSGARLKPCYPPVRDSPPSICMFASCAP